MKVAIITDIHFGVRNNSDFFLQQQEKFFKKVFFPYLKEHKIKNLLILGDTWEDRKSLCPKVFAAARKMFFDQLLAHDIKVKMIYGNHDVFYKDTNEVNTVDVIGDLYSNVQIIPKHRVIKFGSLEVAMISWINKNNFQESMEFLHNTKAPWLLGHFEINSFPMIRGHNCTSGFDKSVFDKFERVLSGHFHVMSDDGKIAYISNPFQTNWSDYDQKKGFRILDTETREMETIYNPYEIYDVVILDSEIDTLNFKFENYTDKIVKIMTRSFCNISKEKVDLFVSEMSKHAHQITLEEIDDSLIGELTSADNIEFQNTFDVITAYVDEVVDDQKDIDKSKILDIFNSLYEKAQTSNINGE